MYIRRHGEFHAWPFSSTLNVRKLVVVLMLLCVVVCLHGDTHWNTPEIRTTSTYITEDAILAQIAMFVCFTTPEMRTPH